MASYGSRHTCSVITFSSAEEEERCSRRVYRRLRACTRVLLLPWPGLCCLSWWGIDSSSSSVSLLQLTCGPRSIVFTAAHHGTGKDPLHPARLIRSTIRWSTSVWLCFCFWSMNSEEVVQGMKVHSGAWLGLWSSAYHQGHIKRLVTSFQKKNLVI
jgi:hypothetical protein